MTVLPLVLTVQFIDRSKSLRLPIDYEGKKLRGTELFSFSIVPGGLRLEKKNHPKKIS